MNSIKLTALAVASLALGSVAFAGAPGHPVAPRGQVVDNYHGILVSDPYRWLEDPASPATVTWLENQAAITDRYFSEISGREVIRRRLTDLTAYRRVDVPWREAGRIFWLEDDGRQPQAVMYTLEEPGGIGRVFFDPNQISPDGALSMGDYVVSPDGRLLAYRAAPGGADLGEIRVRDLEAGKDADTVVAGTNACWVRDGSGFFYARPFDSEPGSSSSARGGMRAMFHRLGEPQSSDRQIMEWDQSARWLYFMTGEDGHCAAMVAEEGPVSEIFVMDLGDSTRPDVAGAPFEVLDGLDAFHTPIDWVDHRFYVRTKLDAPRSRVVSLDLRDGAAARPRAIVPESADVIVDAVITGEHLVVNYLSDVHSRVRLFSLDGTPRGEIPLPGMGAVGWPLGGRPSTPELFFSFESFLAPKSIYRFDVSARKITNFQSPGVCFDASKYETKQVFYTSRDGTRVPMFVTASKDLELDGTHPVFLTAYGGYGATMLPEYSPDIPLWLGMGGIHVLANIRGGGEYGEGWHRAGMLQNKQTTFDDFIAAAEFLVSERYTRTGSIAIYGHSNGGLTIGAALTQRPELFGAAVANAGHYDMLRYHRFTAGAGWVTEYGSADDPATFSYLRAYSPLQNVRDDTCYPATLLLAADHDDRVVPAHAYKFAAALQAAQGCDAPILLRVAANASHSYASRSEMIAECTDIWSFIAANLRISP